MGLLVMVEGGRSTDARLRRALRPLAAFGLVHAVNEWLEMFDAIALLGGHVTPDWLAGIRLVTLAFSFISLAAFGSYLLVVSRTAWRLILLVPLGLEGIWVAGLIILKGYYSLPILWNVADVWTRYSLAIPAALLAAIGLGSAAACVSQGRSDLIWERCTLGCSGFQLVRPGGTVLRAVFPAPSFKRYQ